MTIRSNRILTLDAKEWFKMNKKDYKKYLFVGIHSTKPEFSKFVGSVPSLTEVVLNYNHFPEHQYGTAVIPLARVSDPFEFLSKGFGNILTIKEKDYFKANPQSRDSVLGHYARGIHCGSDSFEDFLKMVPMGSEVVVGYKHFRGHQYGTAIIPKMVPNPYREE